MNKKSILKGTGAIMTLTILCFGIMWLFIFKFNNIDAISPEVSFNNSNAQTLIGAWETIDFRASDGSIIPFEGVVWTFSESEVRYFENGVELLGRPFIYQWINNDTLRMTDYVTNDQRTWQVMFNDDDNNLFVNDIPEGNTRILSRITEERK